MFFLYALIACLILEQFGRVAVGIPGVGAGTELYRLHTHTGKLVQGGIQRTVLEKSS